MKSTKKPTPDERFWAQVMKTDGCWIWTGFLFGRKGNRRGKLQVNKKKWLAYRYSWMIHFGDIPEGLMVCHKCDEPRCVRPDHLFLGTAADNTQDAIRKGRISQNGAKNSQAKLTEIEVQEIRRRRPTESGAKLAKEFNVSQGTISMIHHRKVWTHIP